MSIYTRVGDDLAFKIRFKPTLPRCKKCAGHLAYDEFGRLPFCPRCGAKQ